MYKIYTKQWGMAQSHIRKLLLIMNSALSGISDADKRKWIMRANLITFILMIALAQVSAATFAQKLTYIKQGASLQEVFKQIKTQTGYNVLYSPDQIDVLKKVDVNFKQTDLKKVLNKLIDDETQEYAIVDNNILIKQKKEPSLLSVIQSAAKNLFQSIDVTGRIVDQDGNPIPGATIRVKGTNRSVVSNASGHFAILNVDEKAVIAVSYVGFTSKELPAAKDLGEIKLMMASGELEEVIVNKGYYTTTQRLNTGNVSRVDAKDIERQPVTDPMLALQGRVAGLTIQQPNGNTGRAATIRLRGQNSLANGNDPLVIVDGAQISSTSFSPRIFGGSAPAAQGGDASPFELLNPADIESIDVLKDADATAMYGSRGANGVILITTKSGRAGETKLDVNFRVGASRAPQRVKYLNTEEYLGMREEAFNNDGKIAGTRDYDVNGRWDRNAYTDWQDFFVGGTERQSDGGITISGGNELTSFRIGGTYHQQGTIYPGEFSYKKAGVQFNVKHRSINKRFTAMLSGSYLNNKNALPDRGFSAQSFYGLAPNLPYPFNTDGTLNWAPSGEWINPMIQFQTTVTESGKNLLSNLQLSYKIVDGFEIAANFSYNGIDFRQRNLQPSTKFNPYTTSDETMKTNRQHYISIADHSVWTIEPKLSYQRKFSTGQLDVTVGSTLQTTDRHFVGMGAYGFSSDELIHNIGAGPTTFLTGSSNVMYRYHSGFARVGYVLKDKYILNVTGNRDGSSRFGPENRQGNFGSVGAGWIFTEEPFMKNVKWLNFGKLRASYGTAGNDQIGDYKYLDTYQSTKGNTQNNNFYQNVNGMVPSQLTNPYYGWERVNKLEAGLELSFLDNRFRFSTSVFRNRTKNQLVQYALPSVTGFTSVTANLPAVLQNGGIELGLISQNINGDHFDWTSNLNLTIPNSKLVSYPNLASSSYATRYKEGESLFLSYGYVFNGIDPSTGLISFKDLNVDGTITTAFDQEFNFRGQRLYGGLQNHFRYKGLELDFLLQFSKQQAQGYLVSSTSPGYFNQGQSNQPSHLLGSEYQQKISQTYLGSSLSDFVTRSNGGIIDASYIKLKNVSLSYQFRPLTKLRGLMQSATVYMQAQNLLVFTDYIGFDPETPDSYAILAPLRTVTAGVRISF